MKQPWYGYKGIYRHLCKSENNPKLEAVGRNKRAVMLFGNCRRFLFVLLTSSVSRWLSTTYASGAAAAA